MRVLIRGGVWKNSEDEILKAGVMKYGKNEWARVASLLPRKTARQCKRRWEEWLDPMIKKTEWTREEDEKLLHLAKMMPTQWRTIAPMIGRTANQCLERYGKLLDMASGKDVSEEEEDQARQLRLHETDPNPENKPARPDPVDMDEDEKEMLTEAKARLANVNGKKAKRKAREKLLENARRMARLQKYRELKAAGIGSHNPQHALSSSRKKGQIDYAGEIPFERRVPTGFYGTSEERAEGFLRANERENRKRLLKVANDTPDKRAKLTEEAIEKQKERFDKYAEEDLEGALKLLDERNGDTGSALKLRKSELRLPDPQISDLELEMIGKLGRKAKVLSSSSSSSTSGLLGDYSSSTPSIRRAASVRTPLAPDVVMEEARNQIARTKSKTPLDGGNTVVTSGGTGFDGCAPSAKSVVTPSIVTPSAQRGGSVATASSLSRERGAALRDHLKLNQEDLDGPSEALVSKQEENERAETLKSKLRKGLGSLPAPKYFGYEGDFAAQGNKQKGNDEDEADDDDALVQDAGDLEAEERLKEHVRVKANLSKRSEVAKRGLPIPQTFPEKADEDDAIRQKLYEIVSADVAEKEYDHRIESQVEDLIKREADKMFGEKYRVDVAKFTEEWKERRKGSRLIPKDVRVEVVETKKKERTESTIKHSTIKLLLDGPFVFRDDEQLSPEDHLLSNKMQFFAVQEKMVEFQEKLSKIFKKYDKITRGLQNRAEQAKEEFATLQQDLETAERNMNTFRHMHQIEDAAIPLRVGEWQELADRMSEKEQQLQEMFLAVS